MGQANHRNPIPIFIPCHRVVGADGTLTGYAGGLELKRVPYWNWSVEKSALDVEKLVCRRAAHAQGYGSGGHGRPEGLSPGHGDPFGAKRSLSMEKARSPLGLLPLWGPTFP
ncbi:MAG: methylated-DNA--[protein]-cysteine S-methyltransferase [Intestinimonas sp.]